MKTKLFLTFLLLLATILFKLFTEEMMKRVVSSDLESYLPIAMGILMWLTVLSWLVDHLKSDNQ